MTTSWSSAIQQGVFIETTLQPIFFFKLDITKAFDSVRPEYQLNLIRKLGFPSRWRDWVGALLSTSSSRVLLNGVPNTPIKHGRGLRQGDPLSPLLFVLAIDPLQKVIELAIELQMLTRLRGRAATIRTSMYADDTVIFVNPVKEDVTTLANILDNFGEVSCLQTNFQKST